MAFLIGQDFPHLYFCIGITKFRDCKIKVSKKTWLKKSVHGHSIPHNSDNIGDYERNSNNIEIYAFYSCPVMFQELAMIFLSIFADDSLAAI